MVSGHTLSSSRISIYSTSDRLVSSVGVIRLRNASISRQSRPRYGISASTTLSGQANSCHIFSDNPGVVMILKRSMRLVRVDYSLLLIYDSRASLQPRAGRVRSGRASLHHRVPRRVYSVTPQRDGCACRTSLGSGARAKLMVVVPLACVRYRRGSSISCRL